MSRDARWRNSFVSIKKYEEEESQPLSTDNENMLLEPATSRQPCLNFSLIALFALIVVFLSAALVVLFISRDSIAKLNPHNCLIISPWGPEVGVNRTFIKPCILSALEGTRGGHRRIRCIGKNDTFCPINYTCSTLNGLDVCRSGDFNCGDAQVCLDFYNQLELTTFADGIKAIVFADNVAFWWASLVTQAVSIVTFVVVSSFIYVKINPHNFLFSSTQKFIVVAVFCVLEIGILVTPQIITITTASPDFWTMSQVLEAKCFSIQLIWFSQLVDTNLAHAGLTGGSIIFLIILGIGLLARGISRVREAFWNFKNFVLMFLLLVVSTGCVTLIVMGVHVPL